MPDFIYRILPVIAAGAMAYIVFALVERFLMRGPRTSKRLGDFVGSVAHASGKTVQYGSHDHKVRIAFQTFGVDVTGWEDSAVWLGRIVIGIVICLAMLLFVGLPPLVSMVGLLGGFFLMDGLIEGAWDKVRLSIEREIPVFLNGLASTIQITQDVLQAIEDEAGSLSPNGPLRGWLLSRLVSEGSARGQESIREVTEEAFTISSSLGIMVFLISRLWETGGKEWGRAFAMAGGNLEGVLDARVMAQSAGEGAKGSVKIIAAMTTMVIISMARNPSVAETMAMPLMQLVYAGLVLAMLFGWSFMNQQINEAL